MNLPNCNEFCTVDKCLELEYKIAQLQFQIDGIRGLLNQHINQDIPTAHDYTPLVSVESFIEGNNILTTSVTIDDINDFNLIQSRINRNIICNIDLPEMPDVVTIVASEKDVHRVKTK